MLSARKNPGAAGTAHGAEKNVQASTPNDSKDSPSSSSTQERAHAPSQIEDSSFAEGSQRGDSLRCYRWDELHNLPSNKWLIKGLLSEGGFSTLVGKSGSRKSFLAIDIAACVARGVPWCGKKVKQGAGLFIAAEGGRGIVERFKAYEKRNGVAVAGIPLFVLPEAIDLRSAATDVEALVKRIAQIEADERVHFELIIVDTLNCAMAGGDENSPVDMGALLRNCDLLRKKTGAHVMMVHHHGKDASRGARGHSSFKAAVDTELEVVAKGTTTAVTVKKQRDGMTGGKFSFEAEIVDLGTDEDGDAITSCVLISNKATAAGPDKSDAVSDFLTKSQRIALEALNDVLQASGVSPATDSGVPDGITTVASIAAWRAQSYEVGISNGKERAKQKAFQAAVEVLQTNRLIGTAGEFAWITPKH